MKFRAIIIDDNEEVRSVISSIMELRAYEVVSSPEPADCPVYSELRRLMNRLARFVHLPHGFGPIVMIKQFL